MMLSLPSLQRKMHSLRNQSWFRCEPLVIAVVVILAMCLVAAAAGAAPPPQSPPPPQAPQPPAPVQYAAVAYHEYQTCEAGVCRTVRVPVQSSFSAAPVGDFIYGSPVAAAATCVSGNCGTAAGFNSVGADAARRSFRPIRNLFGGFRGRGGRGCAGGGCGG